MSSSLTICEDKPATIMLVEDDPGDQELTRRSFRKARIRNEVQIFSDGESALECLRRQGSFAGSDEPHPDLILLDLNMPGLDGGQVWKQINEDEELRGIPVVAMTASEQESDIVRSYDLRPTGFVTKPITLDALMAAIRPVDQLWIEVRSGDGTRPAVILLVEDDPADQVLTARGFSKAKVRNTVRIVSDGEEALEYLHRRGAYSDPESSPRPDLVLLDLNMPLIGGEQVLTEVRQDANLRDIAVFVTSTSENEECMERSFDLGATGYITKPLRADAVTRLLSEATGHSLQIVALDE